MKILEKIRYKNMLEKVKATGLDLNNFIFVSPEAKSNPSLNIEFWEDLNKLLTKLGFDLFTTFLDNVYPFNIKHCNLNKWEVQALCNLSKGIIGIKSGLIEPLLSIKGIPIIIITSMYARPDANLAPMSVEDHVRACSNLKLPDIDAKNIHEINVESLDKYQILNIILNILRPKLKYVETHIVDHCNLNCQACCHYCNVTEPNFIDIDDFESDFRELSSKFEIEQIRLMGGEPLLHKQINEFLKISRKYFPSANIRIVTNGILLSKMPEDFWETIKETNIKIDLTKYPIGGTSFSEGLDSIGKHVFERYYDENLGFWVQKTAMGNFWIAQYFALTLDARGTSDIQTSFKRCPYKRCVNLIKGKLVHCPTAGYMHNYNTYFKKNLSCESGIDIYKHTAKEIIQYLSEPIDTCKYCVVDDNVVFEPWAVSKKEENEWFVDKS